MLNATAYGGIPHYSRTAVGHVTCPPAKLNLSYAVIAHKHDCARMSSTEKLTRGYMYTSPTAIISIIDFN